jgi:hypothetical protein
MKNFKKLITSTLLAGIMIFSVGCSSTKNNSTNETATLDVATMKTNLENSDVLSADAMDTPASEHWMFADVKDKIQDGFVSQALINVKLQDVVVVKTTDTDAVVSAIENYKKDALALFAEGYGGDENITAVTDSKLEVVGDVVYFIATPNAVEVENVLLGK